MESFFNSVRLGTVVHECVCVCVYARVCWLACVTWCAQPDGMDMVILLLQMHSFSLIFDVTEAKESKSCGNTLVNKR